MERFVAVHRRQVVVKIHDLDKPSPAEEWLLRNATHEATLSLVARRRAEIRYFVTGPR